MEINYPFIENKYSKCYFALIDQAKKQNRNNKQKLFEKHHIYPRSFYKIENKEIDNSKDNLVLLTPKEHFICHWLLTKSVRSLYREKMIYAFWRINNKNGIKTSISYESARRNRNKLESERMIQKYSDPKEREKQSEQMKGCFRQKPEMAEKISAKAIESWSNEDRRLEASERNKARYENEEEKIKTSLAVKKAYEESNGEIVRKIQDKLEAYWAKDGSHEAQSKKQKERWSSEEGILVKEQYKKRNLGGGNPSALPVEILDLFSNQKLSFGCKKDVYQFFNVSEYIFRRNTIEDIYLDRYRILK